MDLKNMEGFQPKLREILEALDKEASEIPNGSITAEKLADGSVTDDKLANQKINKNGDTVTGQLVFADPQNRSKIILTKYPDGVGHNNAPTTLDLNSVYLHIGGTEFNTNSYRLIGFGYRRHEDSSHAAGVMGYQEINADKDDMGDLIFATRNSTSDIAPTIHLRIKHDGQVELEQADYSPVSDKAVVNKKYVDDQLDTKLSASQAEAQSDSNGTDLTADFNALLAKLRAAGIMEEE